MSDDAKAPLFNDRVRLDLYAQRVVVLDGPLDDDNGTLLATQMIALATEDAVADIALWIHSPGGSVPSMLVIRDVMRLVPCDVSTLALGPGDRPAVARPAVAPPAAAPPRRPTAAGVVAGRPAPAPPGLAPSRHRP